MALKQPPQARSVLALDVGRRRIGLAGCDPLGLSVTPLPALHRGRFQQDLEQLKPLVEQRRCVAAAILQRSRGETVG